MKQSITQKMLSRSKYLLLICIFLLSTLNGFADHFRYGNLTWQRVPGSANKIKFKMAMAYKRTYFPLGSTYVVGSVVPVGQFNAGIGGNNLISLIITSVNLKDDWFYGEWTMTYTYPNSSATYKAFYNAATARLGPPLINNPVGNISVTTMVQIGNGNDAPVSTIPPIVNVRKDLTNYTYQIPAIDPNGDALTYSLTPNDSFGVGTVQPIGLSISSTGLLSWNTVGKTVGDLYNASVRAKDSKGAYISLDFLLRIVDLSTPSDFDYTVSPPNGTLFEVQPGDSVSFKVKASDVDTGDSVKLLAIGVPPGGTFTTTGTNPITGEFGWKPTPDQEGDYVISVTSEDKKGVQNNTTIYLSVSYKPRFDIPTMPGNNSVFTLKPGDTISHPVRAYHPDTPDQVILTAISGLKPAMIFNPAFPLAPANPINTNFQWTPSITDWGINRVVYQAEDTFYHEKAYDSIYYLIDNPPIITSVPVTNASVGNVYSYLLKATDLDIPYGDKIKVENINIPSFLSIVNNNNNTWTITGTPGAGNVGTYNIDIEVADSMNHLFGTHAGNAMQNFVLTVIETALSVSGTESNVTIYGNSNGSINITPAGGVGPYTYAWSNSATTEDLSGIAAGTYIVTVTDILNNIAKDTFVITQPAQLTVSGVATDVTIFSGNNGAINITPAGGVGPYSYNWGGGVTSEDRTILIAGTYSVTVTDANGATATASYTINQPAQLTVSGVVSDVTIFGSNNGAINITPAGGVGPYTYAWSNSTTSEDPNGLLAGAYNVVVTDANGATASGSFTVNQPTQLTVSGISANATIFGGNNGAINITPAGGVGPYTYNWGGGVTTEDRTGFAAGSYTVTITDANGATFTATYTVTQPAPLTVSGVANNVSIFGGNNGSVNITPAGGVGPYTYNWGGGILTEDITGIIAGIYTVTVTDVNGATATATYTILQPLQLSITGIVSNVTIFGGNNGSINITPAGGVGPYIYIWSNLTFNEDPTGLSAGTYIVTVKDANLAIAVATFTVSQPALLTVSGTVSNVTIFGANNGSINITPVGGVGPYTYVWSNSTTNEDPTGLTAGSYTVTVTDANGATASKSFTVSQPAQLTATAVITPVAIYGGNTGSINVTPAGGVGPYTYNWGGGITTEDRTGLPAGTYIVTITDANGATFTATYTVSQPAQLTISGVVSNVTVFNGNNGAINITPAGGVGPYTYVWNNNSTNEDRTGLTMGTYSVTVTDANGATATGSYTVTQPAQLTVSGVVSNVTIFNGNNGAINITPVGGVGPYTYVWNNNSTNEDRTGLTAGTYSVTVKDANNATATATFTVTQPTPPLTINGTVTNVTCNGGNNGAINISVSGGTGPYAYSWSTGTTTQNISGRTAGTYTVTVTGANNATGTATFTVAQPSAIVLSTVINNVNCNGGDNGNIDLSVSGGTGPYTYSWNLGGSNTNNNNCYNWWWWWCSNNCNNNNNNTNTQDVSDLSEGNYSVTVTDNKGCSVTGNYTITEPNAIVLTATKTNVTCKDGNNGTITLSVSGGTSPYTYNWYNGSNWCSNNANVTTQNRTGLDAGTYSVKVTDAKGCTKTLSVSITEPSTGVTATATTTNINCKGSSTGAINLSVSGGSSPYSYSWTGGATTQDVSNKVAGTYTVVITDANGCSVSKTYTITEPSTALALNAVTANVSCYGEDNGSINLSVSGGSSPYTYKWNNNANCQDRTDLTAGTYSVIVTDNKGCTTTGSYTITQPTAIVLTATKTNVTCKDGNNGTITLNVSGGTVPYTYSWYSGSNWCSNSGNVTTQNRNGLDAGTYSVKVTDAKGCTKTLSVSITEPSSGMTASSTTTSVTCKGSSTGGVNLSVSGGTSPYTYSWTGGATTQDISNKPAGTYIVTITDASNCSISKTYTITEPSTALSLTATTTNVQCYGEDDGAINLSVSGGTSPYTYKWNNNATCQDRTGLVAGTYSVIVTDNKGCTATGSYTITAPTSGITVSSVITHVSCNNGNNGAINVSVSGGSSPYSYNWSNSSNWCSNNNNITTQDRSNLDAGSYSVKVTDSKGCSKTITFTVTEPNSISGSISGSSLIYKGYGSQSVTLTTSASGGNGGYTYQWTPSSTVSNATAASTSVSPSSTTTYSCKITDSKGCTKTITKTITVDDVRCGSNNDKVVMCRNNNQVCVSQSQVQSYLNNGYSIGECYSGCKTTETSEDNGIEAVISQEIKIYPNPTNGLFLLELPAGVTNADIMVTDMAGKMIEHRTAMGVNSIRFDLGKVARGTYLINVASGKNNYQSKVTIQ